MLEGSAVETRLMVVQRSTMGTVDDGTKVFSLEVSFPVPVEAFHIGKLEKTQYLCVSLG